MPDSIVGGLNRRVADVNRYNELLVHASSEHAISDFARREQAYAIGTAALPVKTTAGAMLWVRNDDTTYDFFVTDVWVSWNGDTKNDYLVGLRRR